MSLTLTASAIAAIWPVSSMSVNVSGVRAQHILVKAGLLKRKQRCYL